MKAKSVNQLLMLEFHALSLIKQDHVYHPGKDFTRHRKLSFEQVIATIINFENGELDKELLRLTILISIPAFVQQRNKIKVEAFRNLFLH